MHLRYIPLWLIIALALTSFPLVPAQAVSRTRIECGFYLIEPNIGDLTAKYRHCGNTSILIKIHWSNGGSYGICVPPWEEIPFYRDGTHRVVEA